MIPKKIVQFKIQIPVKILLLYLLIFTNLTLQAQKQLINDPNAEVRNIDASFTSVNISGGIEVYFSQGNTDALAVSAAKQEYTGAIKTIVQNGELRIFCENIGRWPKAKNKQLRVYISGKSITKIQASSTSSVFILGKLETPSFTVSLSGTSTFAGSIGVDKLTIDLSGASDAKLNGYAKEVSIAVSGASDMLSYNLVAEVCHISASGASDVKITVNKEISVSASGASDIAYKGTAVLHSTQTSGASVVTRIEE